MTDTRNAILRYAGCLALISCLAETALGETVNPLIHPGNRFARENPSNDRIAFWPSSVSIQFLSLRQEEVRLIALASFLSLSMTARANVGIIGFPDNIFGNNLTVQKEVNLLVWDYNSANQEKLLNGGNLSSLEKIDLSNADQPIVDIFNKGLIEQSQGCLSGWRASQDNEIEGFVLAIASNLSVAEKKDCVTLQAPSAYGVAPVVSLYNVGDVAEKSARRDRVIFQDMSEVHLELAAAAACREELLSFGAICPFRIIDQVFSIMQPSWRFSEHQNDKFQM